MVELESNGKVSARKLHKWLESKKKFSDWWDYKVDQAELVENQDYLVGHKFVTSFNREYDDFHLTSECSQELALMEGTKRGKQVRKLLQSVFNQAKEGALLSGDEVVWLMKVIKVMFFVEPRNHVKDLHFHAHNDKYTFHKYRSELVGTDLSKEQLAYRLRSIGIKYQNQQQALMNLDKFELVRIAMIDFLKALGKEDKFAVNVGNTSKRMAKEMNMNFGSIKDGLFKPPKEIVETYEKLFYHSRNVLKEEGSSYRLTR